MYFGMSTQTNPLSLLMACKWNHRSTDGEYSLSSSAKKPRYGMKLHALKDREYFFLQNFFLNETSPYNLEAIAMHIGFPQITFEKLRSDYVGKDEVVMKILFETWFPVAQQIAHTDNITPREILAHAYNLVKQEDTFISLIESPGRRYLVESNNKHFQLLSMAIAKSILKHQEEEPMEVDNTD